MGYYCVWDHDVCSPAPETHKLHKLDCSLPENEELTECELEKVQTVNHKQKRVILRIPLS